MKRHLVAVALASTILTASVPAFTAPAALVRASGNVEPAIAIALVNVHAPVSLERDAQTLAADVNRVRSQRGLPLLTRDASLDRFAQAKAADMAARGYFGHTSPDGVSFQDRMRAGRWPTQYVAENIAFDVNEPAAHRAFVNSPPHY